MHLFPVFPVSVCVHCAWCMPQSTLRVAMATFWRTFHHDGKISPAWLWGGGVYALPLSLYLPSRANFVVYTLQLRGQIHPISPLPLFVLCGACCLSIFHKWYFKTFKEHGNRFQGIDSASLYVAWQAGTTTLLAPIDLEKFQHRCCLKDSATKILTFETTST
jgi:hypothetical protein